MNGYFFIGTASRVIGSAVAIVTLVSASSLTWMEQMPFPASWPNLRVPKWSNEALVEVQYDDTTQPLIWLYDRQSAHSIPFSIPGARSMTLYDWDRGPQGDIGVSGSVIDVEGRGTAFVAWISPDASKSVIIRTGMYRPMRLAVAPDGSLWTSGPEVSPSTDPAVVRHFDQSGTLLSSLIPQSTFADVKFLSDRHNRMRASRDRIAWYSPLGARYMEISLSGQLMANFSASPPGLLREGYGFALTDKDEAYLTAISAGSSSNSPNDKFLGVYTLDKVAHSWKSVIQRSIKPPDQPNPDIGHLYGVDGNNLVFGGLHRINFYSISN